MYVLLLSAPNSAQLLSTVTIINSYRDTRRDTGGNVFMIIDILAFHIQNLKNKNLQKNKIQR